MLSCIISESPYTTGNQVVDIFEIIVLEKRILCIHVGQSSHLTCCALEPVVIVSYLVESISMIEAVMSSNCIIQSVLNTCIVNGSMIRYDVYDNLKSVTFGLST